MKNIFRILVVYSVVLSFMSCQNGKEQINAESNAKGVKTDKIFQSILFKGSTIYSKLLYSDSPLVGYISSKSNSLAEEELSIFDLDQSPVLRINNMAAAELNLKKHNGLLKSVEQQEKIQLFGSEVTFGLKGHSTSKLKAVGEPADSAQQTPEITMYVPEVVEITLPHIEEGHNLMPFCYYKGFVLKWNADSKNENGLIVIAEWAGMDMFGQKIHKYVRNIDIITEDNGSCVLDEKLFENIPQAAIVTLYLIRGNIELWDKYYKENGEEETLRLFAGSIAMFPFFMVKEIQ